MITRTALVTIACLSAAPVDAGEMTTPSPVLCVYWMAIQ